MKYRIFYSLLSALILLALPSCNGEQDDVITYTVTKGNFQNILTVDGIVESERSTTITCPIRIDGTVAFLIEDGTWVEEGDTVCIIEDMTVKTRYDKSVADLKKQEANLAKKIANNNMEMALLESQYQTNEADTKIAQLDSLQLLYMPAGQRRIQELELRKVALEKRGFDERMKAMPIIHKADVQGIEREINRIKDDVRQMEELLASLVILAPKKGLVTRAQSVQSYGKVKVGDNVWNRIPVAVMPEMEDFKVKIYLKETDFKYITQGDSVIYRFHAMPDETAFGKVTKKVMAGVPIANGSKVKMFEVEASLDSMSAIPDPGFSVECDIILKEQKDVVFVPQVTVFQDDSIKVVFLKEKSGYEKRQVETSLSSQTDVIITAGLEAGDEIAFLRPSESLIVRTTLLKVAIDGMPWQSDVVGWSVRGEAAKKDAAFRKYMWRTGRVIEVK